MPKQVREALQEYPKARQLPSREVVDVASSPFILVRARKGGVPL